MVDSERTQALIASSRRRVQRRREVLRIRRFGPNNDRLPYPMINLDPSQLVIWQRALQRQARKEQMGLARGNAGTAAMMGMEAAKGQKNGGAVRPGAGGRVPPPEGTLPSQ